MAIRDKFKRIFIISWIWKLISYIKSERQYRKKIKELKKRDPFIY